MSSSRWLKPAANPKEPAGQDEPTPNVSMRDVRRLAREKAARRDSEAIERFTANTTAPTTAPTTVKTPVDTTVTEDQDRLTSTTVTTPVDTTVVSAAVMRSASETKGHTQPTVYEDTPITSESQPRAVQPQYLDATHTASEQRVYSVMYRETISKGVRERHYGPKELCIKTGIRSDRTVRMAVRGLIQKFSIEVISHGAYFPQGPRYRVYEPKEVLRRRRAAGMEIDPQTKKIIITTSTTVGATVDATVTTPAGTPVGTAADGGGKSYSSTAVETTGVTPVEVTGVYKEVKGIGRGHANASSPSSNDLRKNDDDEAFAAMVSTLRQVVMEITGKPPSTAEAERWRDLAELLSAELRVAASRTAVSSVPAFLTEHLRRRLFKRDRQQIEREVAEASRPDAQEEKATHSKPHLDADQLQEQVNMMVELLQSDRSIESLDVQFAGSFRPVQWHTIRSMALAQLRVTRPPEVSEGAAEEGKRVPAPEE